MLHLGELGLGGQHDGVVTGGPLVTEEHAADRVQTVAGPGRENRGAEAAETEHGGGRGADDRQPEPVAPRRCRGGIDEGRAGLGRCHDVVHRDLADLVAPARQQEREVGVTAVGGEHRLLGGQCVQELVGAVDVVEGGVTAVGGPATEIRHVHLPL